METPSKFKTLVLQIIWSEWKLINNTRMLLKENNEVSRLGLELSVTVVEFP